MIIVPTTPATQPSWSTFFTDDFNRANTSSLSGYTHIGSAATAGYYAGIFGIQNNVVIRTDTYDGEWGFCVYSNPAPGSDIRVTVTNKVAPTDQSALLLAVGDTVNGYCVAHLSGTSYNQYQIRIYEAPANGSSQSNLAMIVDKGSFSLTVGAQYTMQRQSGVVTIWQGSTQLGSSYTTTKTGMLAGAGSGFTTYFDVFDNLLIESK